MEVNLQTLLQSPDLYLHSYEADFARFVAMDRAHFEDSIFLDRRIKRRGEEIYRIPLDVLHNALENVATAPPRLHFIHHIAQCGSTLLARALDLPGRDLVHREPYHLRQMGVQMGANPNSALPRFDPWRAMLRLSLQQLAKSYGPDQRNIVKGNVPVSMIAGAIEKILPGQAGILLYFPLEDYLAAVLRTEHHGAWVDSVVGETQLHLDPDVGDLSGLSTAQKAAALWLVLMRKFHELQASGANYASLDANYLFDEPASAIKASADHLGLDMGADKAAEIADGPLFSTYAKNPVVLYDPAQRVERREETKRELRSELDQARVWVEQRMAGVGLPATLANPLAGEAPSLL